MCGKYEAKHREKFDLNQIEWRKEKQNKNQQKLTEKLTETQKSKTILLIFVQILYKLSEQPCQVFMYLSGWMCSIF